jgi:hypothetical protein
VAALFTAHPLVLQTAYADLKRLALEQPFVLIGTPGTVSVREVKGQSFFYRQFYDPEGAKKAEYIGPVSAPEAVERAGAIRAQIERTNALLEQARILARAGYVRTDARAGSVIAAVANAGLFRAGATLVGSHAYGVLLNDLGVRAAAFRTADVDIARGDRLTLETRFEEVLEASTLALTPVLGFDRKIPPTSYSTRGRDGIRVDLLMPTSGSTIVVRPVPELDAHATALPHLRFLLDAPLDAVVLGRESVVAVRVPRPERLAWHKTLVSQLRTATSEKRAKDIHQAAVLFATLAEQEPATVREAFVDCPAKKTARKGAEQVLAVLDGAALSRAAEVLSSALS